MFRHVEFALVSTLFAAQFAAAADLPKEGDFKLTFHVITKSRRSIPMPEGQFANLNLETLVTTNDAGNGFLHSSTGRCMGMSSGDAKGGHATGFCTHTDADGDLIFLTLDVGFQSGSPITGRKTYTGGTGKYAGLNGNSQYTLKRLRSVEKDGQAVYEGHEDGHYKIQAAEAQRQ